MGGKFVDITGRRFGSLVVLGLEGERCVRTRWRCQCDCGAITSPLNFSLKRGTTRSCGAPSHKKGVPNPRNATHGRSETAEYRIWTKMRARCERRSDPAYPRYGGRGIKVSDRWSSFEAFYADMGPRPDDCEIDRIDNNGHYEFGNCRWATLVEQANNKRNNRLVRRGGEFETVAEYAARNGIKYNTAYYALVRKGRSSIRRCDLPIAQQHLSAVQTVRTLEWD